MVPFFGGCPNYEGLGPGLLCFFNELPGSNPGASVANFKDLSFETMGSKTPLTTCNQRRSGFKV